ncbi:MAG: site-specific integrase [Treponema sp.]|nr:site-specific integrase [Treponema sp.]
MEKLPYHVFKKSKKTKDGKKFYRWYYYYLEPQTGKKIQKACPNCRNRSDAENYIRTIPLLTVPGAKNPNITVGEIAKQMYIPGSAHVDRRRQLGKSIEIETMLESRRYIKNIINQWGKQPLKDIEADDVINYLFNVSRSGSWKNRFIQIFREIYEEATRHGCKLLPPVFPSFARNVKKGDIFTSAELTAFFKPENFPDYQFYVFFLLSLSAGLRLGEARAVRYKQINFERKLLIIDGFCKADGLRTNYNKKGNEAHPNFRAVYLPDFTLDRLSELTNKTPAPNPDDFIFIINGKAISKEYAESVFKKSLVKAGLALSAKQLKEKGVETAIAPKAVFIPGGRKLTPHSLRFTYISRMRRELSAKELQPFTGHSSTEMVEYYNQKDLEQIVESLPNAEVALGRLLNFITANTPYSVG